jgi:hypothetical protein
MVDCKNTLLKKDRDRDKDNDRDTKDKRTEDTKDFKDTKDNKDNDKDRRCDLCYEKYFSAHQRRLLSLSLSF